MYQPRRHLSQMHAINYRPFIQEKAADWKQILSQQWWGRPPAPSPWIRHCPYDHSLFTGGIYSQSLNSHWRKKIVREICTTQSKHSIKISNTTTSYIDSVASRDTLSGTEAGVFYSSQAHMGKTLIRHSVREISIDYNIVGRRNGEWVTKCLSYRHWRSPGIRYDAWSERFECSLYSRIYFHLAPICCSTEHVVLTAGPTFCRGSTECSVVLPHSRYQWANSSIPPGSINE